MDRGLQELLLIGQVVLALACQLTLAMFHAVRRPRRNARIIMLAARATWDDDDVETADVSYVSSMFPLSEFIWQICLQPTFWASKTKKNTSNFLQIRGIFFFVSITFLIQYPSKWAEKCFMETRLLWLPSPKPCCGASNRTIHPFLAMSQWDSWGTPCTISCVFWWSLERTS